MIFLIGDRFFPKVVTFGNSENTIVSRHGGVLSHFGELFMKQNIMRVQFDILAEQNQKFMKD